MGEYTVNTFKMFVIAALMLHVVVYASSKIDKVEKHTSHVTTAAVPDQLKKLGIPSLFISFLLFPGVSDVNNPRIYSAENKIEYVFDIQNVVVTY